MIIGVAAALRARSLPVAFGVGVGTHFLADMVPHYDYNPYAYGGAIGGLDIALGLGAVALIARRDRALWAAAFGAVTPDLISLTEKQFGTRVTLGFHEWMHTSVQPGIWAGGLTQVVATAAAITVVLKYGKHRRSEQRTASRRHR